MPSKKSIITASFIKSLTFLDIFFFVLCGVTPATTYSQIKGKISGVVISQNQKEKSPVSSATVVLHSSSDSSIVTGFITQKKGNFSFNITEGDFYIEIKHLGYETKIIPDLIISKNNTEIKLGEIEIYQIAILQDEITVEAEKEQVVLGIDSKIFNIDKEVASGSENVLDVLRKIPSVNVDIDDNITMNGTTPKILIDGRESNYSKKEVLKMLSSDLVQSVELITNPSAKYESEGVSGIIDIALKKKKDDGFNGMLNLNTSTDEEFEYQKNMGIGFTGNYKLNNKVNFFGNFNYSKWTGYSDWISRRVTWLSEDTVFTNRNGKYNYDGNWISSKIGIDYLATSNDAISFSADIGISTSDNGQNENYLMSDFFQHSLKKYDIVSKNNHSGIYYNTAVNYKKTFEKKGHNLYVDAYISNDVSDGESNSTFNYYEETQLGSHRKDLLKNPTNNKSFKTVFQIDYEKKFDNILGSFGAGAKSILKKIDNLDNTQRFNAVNEVFETNKLLSDEYKFNDAVNSAYFTIGNKIDNFSYRAGLRAEYTNWTFDSKSQNSSYSDNYFSLIPTVHLKYSIDYVHTFSASYSRRIERPWYQQLNPFMNLYDSNSVTSGNPELKASYYNSYQIDYMFFTPKTTITTSAFYKNTNNASQYYHTTTEWGGLYSRPINVAKNSRIGASISFMQTITDWWNINAYLSASNVKYDAPTVGINNKEQTNWSLNLSSSVKILEDLRMQLYGYYAPSSISLQGSKSSYYTMSAGFSYTFLDKKMSLNFSGYNLIYPANNEQSNFGEYFSSYSVSNWMHRSFSLGISYKFNNFEQKQERGLDSGGSAPYMDGSQKGGI